MCNQSQFQNLQDLGPNQNPNPNPNTNPNPPLCNVCQVCVALKKQIKRVEARYSRGLLSTASDKIVPSTLLTQLC